MEAKDLQALIGENAREIRTESGLTMDAVARVAREYGLKWTTARVVELERGKLAISVATLVTLAHVLATATDRRITLQDLLDGHGYVTLTPSLTVTTEALRDAVSGGVLPFRVGDLADGKDRMIRSVVETLAAAQLIAADVDPEVWTETLRTAGLADERAAERIGIDRMQFLAHAARLWGRSLTAERDRRSGEGVTAQARGQITRQLEKAVRDAVEARNG